VKNQDPNNIIDKFFNFSIDLLCVADKNGILLKVNPAWEKALGYTASELEGKQYIDLIHPDDSKQTSILSKNEPTVDFVNRYRHKNGTYRWLQWRSYSDSGNIYAIARDVTEQKKAEEDLQIFKVAIENSNEAIYWMDINAKFIFTNKCASDMLGYSNEELSNMSVFDIDPVFTREQWDDSWEKQRHNPTANAVFETVHKRKDGVWINIEISTHHLSFGKNEYHIAHVRDITDRKKAEETLNMFKVSSEASMDAVYWFTSDGHFLYTNKSACEMLGYSNEELLKMRVFDIDPAYPQEEWNRQWDIFRKTKQSRNIHLETVHRRKDGTILFVDVVTSYVLINGKECQIANGRDITEKKKKEIELNRFKLSIDNAMDGVYWINEQGGFDYVNDKACEMLGYTHEELIKLYIPDIDESIPKSTYKEEWDEFCKNHNNNTRTFETRQKKKDGSYLPVEINAIFVWIDDKRFLITYTKDLTERKEYENKLLKNQKLLKDSQRIARMGSYEMDISKKRIYLQDEAYDILGYKKDEISIILDDFGKFVYHEDLPYVQMIYLKMLDKKEFIPHQCRFVQKNGEIRTLQINGELCFDSNNTPIRAYGIMQDVTERKKAEEEIIKEKDRAEESEQRLKALQNASFGGIAIHDKGIILDCNKSLTEISGYSYNELIGMNGLLLIAEQSRDFVMDKITSGYEKAYETTGLRKNGEEFPLRLEARNIPFKGSQVRSVEFRDITDIKNAEEELRKAKEEAEEREFFLKESQQIGNIGSYRINLSTREWYGTETLAKIFGIDTVFPKKDKTLEQIVHPDDVQIFKNHFYTDVLGKHKLLNKEYRIIRQTDKEVRWVYGVGKLYYNEEDATTHLLMTIQDITERKQIDEKLQKVNITLEEKVQERTLQLQQANKDLESFAYSVSHDLRAPIRHIGGFMQLMQKALNPMSPRVENYFNKIMISSKSMSSMIDELLNFSRLGRSELNKVESDLNKIIHNIIIQLKPDYEDREILWNISKLPIINGDPNLLKIAFENLISNAIKYTSSKEQAIIEIGEQKTEDNQVICIYIKDNGAGFDMEYKDKLFGVFQRLHTNDEFEGIGIGLANVKRIITKHRGSIRAEGAVNEGATFFISLPK